MKAVELEKAYAPKSFEDRIYSQWKEGGAFKPKEGKGNPYVIVIPPPNVTGVLHLGHGLNITLQDIVIRFHRMRGEPALWVPGTDHAGIATQNVVEKKLKGQGISRRSLGREKFVEETWKVKGEHHAIISKQLARMGASVDWSRERFTLDEGLSRAVREVFVTLYERDLLYKGHYLVNWCCSCGTAISDDEVDHEKQAGKMYHIRYPRVDGAGSVEIATTRPETLLGDTAVAVHPEDPRYADIVGRELVLPLAGRNIPVIADAYVDREFGTGAVKITPAHDPNDWEMARRQNLPVISILRPDGRLNDAAPEKYRGLTVAEAREAVLADLKAGGFYVKEEEIIHAVGRCYRCHTVIEPFLSEQWFVRMKPLADKALAAWHKGDIIFYPRKWENTYQRWLENIRDWCVSRQLWWGHRIPAWRCKKCGKTSVSRTDLVSCPHCGSFEIEQDPDVLDTWFSSWLWPFSTLGWPEALSRDGSSGPSDFDRFYPTTALVTAYDIIFFWVSRMIMAGLEFTGKAPFRDIYIHGIIRDKQGRKMSKSLGNGLDPLQLVDEYGADALRFTLAFMCAQGQDILIDEGSFKLGSKFANKVWNAARYILMNLEGRNVVKDPALLPVDRWIRSRLGAAARTITGAFLSYRYNDAAQTAYEYFWNDFCDWYVEAAKLSMKEGDDAEKDRAATVLLEVLAESLRLLHPLIPFVTEEIYGKLPYKGAAAEGTLLIDAPYPEYDEDRADPRIEADFAFIQELITQVRTLRSECTVTPDKKVRILVRTGSPDRTALFRENAGLVKLLAGVGDLEIEEGSSESGETPAAEEKAAQKRGSIGLAGSGFDVFVFIAEAVDLAVLKQKFAKELAKDSKFITGLQAKLSNENFLGNAPPELVEQERVKLEEALKRTVKLESYIRDLGACPKIN
ncbi:MAG: valine--tRNA ligase [Treponema sp.]|jgi:valyl-tRNA synthetase|nr:valine--tRNA ligase [Treponema sp.]